MSDYYIDKISDWLDIAGQKPTTRNVALYVGLQCEEFAEKLAAMGFIGASEILSDLGNDLKAGIHDFKVSVCLANYETSIKMLDADADLLWVTIGAAEMCEFDIEGALLELVKSNFSKFKDGQAIKDKNGKIVKPDTYIAPDFSKFI